MKIGQNNSLKNLFFNRFLLVLFLSILLFPMLALSQNQKVLIIDRFEQWKKNEVGGNADVFADEDGKATILMETGTGINTLDNKGKSINLKYNVTQAEGYCGYYSKFPDLDLGEYHYMSFWIKGKNGKEYMKVQLKNNIESASVALWNYLVGGPDTSWRKVMIPLDAFWNLSSLQHIKELVFVFENYQSSKNESPLESEVFIDDVVLGSFFPGFVKVDHFDDKIKANATGGNIGEFSYPESYGLYTSEIICQMYHKNPCALEVHYNNGGISEFGGEFFILGGGEDGWTKIYKNLSQYDRLHLAVRAASENENPGNLKIELKESSTIHSAKITNITTSFQEYDLKFSDFSPPIQSYDDIGEFTIVFEQSEQEKLKGVVYVDEIEFRSPWYTGEDKTSAIKPARIKINGQHPTECLYVTGSNQIQTSFNGDLSRFESVRLEYRGDTQTNWTVVGRKYQTNNNVYTWQIDASDLPDKSIVDLRAVAQNYSGLETCSDIVYVKTAPFDLSLADLFYNSFQLFQLFRNQNGIYRDALRIDGNHFHPASIAANGMGLISLCIGDAMNWIDNAPQLVDATLRALLNKDNQLQYSIRNAKGYYKHFFNIDTGAPMWNDEYSSIDTGILVCGAIFCQNYFDTNQAISQLVEELKNSMDWSASIANADRGEIYLTFDESGKGIENAITKPYNEYMIVAWLALAQENRMGGPATDLWNKFYSDPSALPTSSYNGIKVLTDVPGKFLSSFTVQFPLYLCHYFTATTSYLQFFENARKADLQWWLDQQMSKNYEWGCGAGSDFPPDYYHADAIEDNPHAIFSPHIIAGFLPIYSQGKQHLLSLLKDGKAIYGIASNQSLKFLWRFSLDDPSWQAEDVQAVDFSTMLFGLAALDENLGLNFFSENNRTSVIPSTKDPFVPDEFRLFQNHPNPFNPTTKIEFMLPKSSKVEIKIYNMLGQEIKTLIDRYFGSGSHVVIWDGRDNLGRIVGSGVYLYRMKANDFISVKKGLLLK